MSAHAVVELEKNGWSALSAGGQTARNFYENVLDHVALMVLPGGIVLDDRAAIIESMSGQPWSSFELADLRAFELAPGTTVVLYGVVAHRDSQEYSALMSSTYIRRGDDWKLAFHQQTPR